MTAVRELLSPRVLRATVPPLASIFGSGFLIVVPVLERTLGALSVVGIAGVCGFAWLIGTAIRHNMAVERLLEEGRVNRLSDWFERGSDLVIAVAYVISVALYLRIMSLNVVEYAASGPSSPSGRWPAAPCWRSRRWSFAGLPASTCSSDWRSAPCWR